MKNVIVLEHEVIATARKALFGAHDFFKALHDAHKMKPDQPKTLMLEPLRREETRNDSSSINEPVFDPDEPLIEKLTHDIEFLSPEHQFLLTIVSKTICADQLMLIDTQKLVTRTISDLSEIKKVERDMMSHESIVTSMCTLAVACSGDLTLAHQDDDGIKRFIKPRIEHATKV